jgi:hypothetical protein
VLELAVPLIITIARRVLRGGAERVLQEREAPAHYFFSVILSRIFRNIRNMLFFTKTIVGMDP